MKLNESIKIRSLVQLYEVIPDDQRTIVDVLRQIIIENLPKACKEKISFNVPYFYGKKGICIVWPAAIQEAELKKGFYWDSGMVKNLPIRTIISRMVPTSGCFIKFFMLLKILMKSNCKIG